jgi:hypothetical protein
VTEDWGKIRRDRRDEPSAPKKKKEPDSEAFREMMKVGKVRETDPEEKRKKKEQAEHEEDVKANMFAGPSQGLEPTPRTPPPFMTEGGQELSIPSSGAGAPSPPSTGEEAEPPFYQPPTPPSPPQAPPQQPQQEPPSPPSPTPPTEAKKKESAAAAPVKKKGAAKAKVEAKKGATAPSKPTSEKEALKTLEKKEKLDLASTPSEKGKKKIEKSTKKEEAQKLQKPEEPIETPIAPAPLPQGAWESAKPSDEKEKGVEKGGMPNPQTLLAEPQTDLPPGATPSAGTPPPSPTTTSPFANLPPQVQQVFERMVGVITVMQQTGVTQTTINLNNPQFANSVFYGAQIMLTEFSTAPKAYNIELLGNQQSVALFNANADDLVAAFQAGNYTFKVNRIDTAYLPATKEVRKREAQKVKRKKSGGG